MCYFLCMKENKDMENVRFDIEVLRDYKDITAFVLAMSVESFLRHPDNKYLKQYMEEDLKKYQAADEKVKNLVSSNVT